PSPALHGSNRARLRGARQPRIGSSMEPVTLRHKDATRQAWLYGAFAALVVTLVVFAFVLPLPGKWLMLFLLPVGAFLTYSAVRLATLQVRLDQRGVWEPNPFRL